MDAQTFLARCADHGVRLRLRRRGETVRLVATGAPPPDRERFRRAVLRLKPQLLELLAARPVEAFPRPAGGEITPPTAQRGLLGPPGAKQGVPACIEGHEEPPEVAVRMRQRIRAAVDLAHAGAFPDLGPVELEAGRVVENPAAWLLLAVERLRRACAALQQTRMGTPAYAARWKIAAEIVTDMEVVADRVDRSLSGAEKAP